jgi:hypothetical protein
MMSGEKGELLTFAPGKSINSKQMMGEPASVFRKEKEKSGRSFWLLPLLESGR